MGDFEIKYLLDVESSHVTAVDRRRQAHSDPGSTGRVRLSGRTPGAGGCELYGAAWLLRGADRAERLRKEHAAAIDHERADAVAGSGAGRWQACIADAQRLLIPAA